MLTPIGCRVFSTWPWPSMQIGTQNVNPLSVCDVLLSFGLKAGGNGIQTPQSIHTPARTHKNPYRFAVCCAYVAGKRLNLVSNLGDSAHGHGHQCGLAGSPNLKVLSVCDVLVAFGLRMLEMESNHHNSFIHPHAHTRTRIGLRYVVVTSLGKH